MKICLRKKLLWQQYTVELEAKKNSMLNDGEVTEINCRQLSKSLGLNTNQKEEERLNSRITVVFSSNTTPALDTKTTKSKHAIPTSKDSLKSCGGTANRYSHNGNQCGEVSKNARRASNITQLSTPQYTPKGLDILLQSYLLIHFPLLASAMG